MAECFGVGLERNLCAIFIGVIAPEWPRVLHKLA